LASRSLLSALAVSALGLRPALGIGLGFGIAGLHVRLTLSRAAGLASHLGAALTLHLGAALALGSCTCARAAGFSCAFGHREPGTRHESDSRDRRQK
jgi:hypothetical protein